MGLDEEHSEQLAVADEQAIMNTISTPFPTYWVANPAIWFMRIEHFFAAKGITRQETKYHQTFAALPDEVALVVQDLGEPMPAGTPYDILKKAVIERTAATLRQRMRQLLTPAELGDRKPSQLLRHMRLLLGSINPDPAFLREIFLQRLPSQVQLVLSSQDLNTSPDVLAELADRAMEIAVPTTVIAAIAPPSAPIPAATSYCPPGSTPTIPQYTTQQIAPVPNASAMPYATAADMSQVHNILSHITSRLEELSMERQSRQQPRWRSRSRPRRSVSRQARTDSPDRRGMCWYHHRFGPAARHCNPPCNFSRQSSSGPGNS